MASRSKHSQLVTMLEEVSFVVKKISPEGSSQGIGSQKFKTTSIWLEMLCCPPKVTSPKEYFLN